MPQRQHDLDEQDGFTVERERYRLAEHLVNWLATFSRSVGLGAPLPLDVAVSRA
jgi:hypothetical protein